MKKTAKIIVFSIVSFLVCGCTEKDNVRTFDMTAHDFEKWDQLVSVEKYVVLEETENSMLAGIDKCVLGDSAIYAFCRKYDKVFKFSLDGKFLSTVGEKGHAKSEYINISDIVYDQKNHQIVIADERGFLWYDSDGRFLRRVPVEDCFLFDLCPNGDMLSYAHDDKYSVTVLKDKKNIGVREKTGYVFFSQVFYRSQDENMVVSDYGQFYIDKYEDGKLTRAYGNEALPEEMRPQTFEDLEKVDNMDDYFRCLQGAYETKKWLYTEFRGPHRSIYEGYINKDNGKVFFGKAPRDEAYAIVGTYQDKFCALLYPEYVGEKSHMKKFLIENGLQDLHNPILIFLEINEEL